MQKLAIIWNPSKTEKKVLESALAATVGDSASLEVTWWETAEDDPGQGVASQALSAGANLVVVAGGDGTVRAVAEHLAETATEADMAIIPLGTGNLFARNLNIPLNDIPAAFERAINGKTRQVDMGWVDVELESGSERHGFVVLIGFGVDAHMIAETSDDLKDKAGWLAYVESLGRALKASESISFHIVKDDEPSRDETGHTLLIANCGTLQGGLTLLPDADPSDGELDYLVLSAEGFGQWAGTLKTMVWDNGLKRIMTKEVETESTASVNYGKARKLEVSLPTPQPFEIDGEDLGKAKEFVVTIQQGALRVR